MPDFLFAFIPFLFPLAIYGALSIVGVVMEQNHEKELDRREAVVGNFPLFDTKTASGIQINAGQLVSGSVVMGTGYLKQFLASVRAIIGGEIKGYQRVLDRARREAQLRMIETAQAQGATAIINVRFETSDVGGAKPFSEIMCYGTMVR